MLKYTLLALLLPTLSLSWITPLPSLLSNTKLRSSSLRPPTSALAQAESCPTPGSANLEWSDLGFEVRLRTIFILLMLDIMLYSYYLYLFFMLLFTKSGLVTTVDCFSVRAWDCS